MSKLALILSYILRNQINDFFKKSDNNGGDDFYIDLGGLLEENPKQLTQVKPITSLSNKINRAISIISLDENNIQRFGSWIYSSQLYPADIDLIETDTTCCSKKEAVKFFAKGLQKIVNRIIKTRGVYLGDIKAGLDEVFMIDMGQLIYDTNGTASITGYYPNLVKEQLQSLKDSKNLTKDEYNYLMSFVKNNMTQLDYENLYDALREKWLLRWSEEEILKGFKELPSGRAITLEKAISQPTMTKIDVWMNIYGRFLEITNVFSFYWTDNKKSHELLNFENDIDNLVDALRDEVRKYAFSIKYFKPFKMVKRLWSIARLTGDNQMIKILTPFMQSDAGRLNQINSEIETLISILENVKNPPMATILDQIDNFRNRLANVYEIKWDQDEVDSLIQTIIVNKKNNIKNKDKIINTLKEMKKYFVTLVNSETTKYLKKNGLLPLPINYIMYSNKGGKLKFDFKNFHF